MVALARTRPLAPGDSSDFAAAVSRGLSATPKRVPAKYFYDDAGSLLFERITELPEYYPTRHEMSILRAQGADIAKLIPAGAAQRWSNSAPAPTRKRAFCFAPRRN
jgi:uncharacterized SAM-dependent methyltransferase